MITRKLALRVRNAGFLRAFRPRCLLILLGSILAGLPFSAVGQRVEPATPTSVVPTEPAQPTQKQHSPSVEDVIQLVQAGLSEDLVIAAIRKRAAAFDLSTDDLLQLKRAGVGDSVIRTMMAPDEAPRETSIVGSTDGRRPPTAPELPFPTDRASSEIVRSQRSEVISAESFPPSTRVQLALSHDISSATAEPGDQVSFRVTDQVSYQNGLLIRQGTLAHGSVKKAKRKSLLSKGKLELDDRVKVRDAHGYELLVILPGAQSEMLITAGAKAVGGAVISPFKGKKNIVLAQGTMFEGIVTKRILASPRDGQATVAATTLSERPPNLAPIGRAVNRSDVTRRIYIKAKGEVVDGIELPSKILEDSVHDLQGMARKRGYAVVESEAAAELMLVVLERKIEEGRPSIMSHKTKRMETILHTALFYKEAGEWKPGLTLTSRAKYWKDAAWKMIREVDKWVEGKLLRQ